MDVRDVQDPDLVAAAERVGLDGRVRARRAGHHAPQLLPEVADAFDRALDGTEQLGDQPEGTGVRGRLERGRVERGRGQGDGQHDGERRR